MVVGLHGTGVPYLTVGGKLREIGRGLSLSDLLQWPTFSSKGLAPSVCWGPCSQHVCFCKWKAGTWYVNCSRCLPRSWDSCEHDQPPLGDSLSVTLCGDSSSPRSSFYLIKLGSWAVGEPLCVGTGERHIFRDGFSQSSRLNQVPACMLV